MIKTNKLLLGLGLSTVIALPLVIVSCDSDEEVIITNLELSPKTNIGVIKGNEVAHLSEVDQTIGNESLPLIKKLFEINNITDQNLISGLKIKMLSNGLNKTISLSVNNGFTINGDLTKIDSVSFPVNVPPIEPPVLDDVLTPEIANDFFASGGKWAGKTSLVAKDFEGFKTIGDSTLSGKSLVSVNFPNSITIIGQNALANNQLTSLSIPNSVTEIGNGAFANNRLTLTSSITLPAQFDNPAERERIGLPFEVPEQITNLELSAKTNIGVIVESEVAHLSETYQNINVNDGSLTLIKKLFDIQGTTTTDQNLMSGLKIKMLPNGSNKKVWLSAKTGFKINGTLTEIDSVSFPVNVPPIEPPILGDILTQEIANSFFASGGKWEGKTSLVAKDFEGFTSIGQFAFENKILNKVIIPDWIIEVGFSAFFYSELQELTLSKNLTRIESFAFVGNKLKTLEIGPKVTFIGEHSFENGELTSLTLPNGLIEIAQNAFGTNKLTSIIIPNTVTKIWTGTFYNNNFRSYRDITISPELASIIGSDFEAIFGVPPGPMVVLVQNKYFKFKENK